MPVVNEHLYCPLYLVPTLSNTDTYHQRVCIVLRTPAANDRFVYDAVDQRNKNCYVNYCDQMLWVLLRGVDFSRILRLFRISKTHHNIILSRTVSRNESSARSQDSLEQRFKCARRRNITGRHVRIKIPI